LRCWFSRAVSQTVESPPQIRWQNRIMKAINETCEQEATDLTDKQTAEDWKVLVDGMRKGGDNKYSTSDTQKAYHRQAKDECIKRKLAGTQ
jgi:hypothetical protein